ncbi:hypothetical protein TWF281_008162 [Arthrobotrys megalospora]
MTSAALSDVSRLPPIHSTYTPDVSVEGNSPEKADSPSASDLTDLGVAAAVYSSPASPSEEEDSPMDHEEPQMTESSSEQEQSDNGDDDFDGGNASENVEEEEEEEEEDVLEIDSSPEPAGRRLAKLKKSKDTAEDYSQNPELWGLRRSSRPVARNKRIIESSDEEGDEEEEDVVSDDSDVKPRKRSKPKSSRSTKTATSKVNTPRVSAESSEDGDDSDFYSNKKAARQKKRRLNPPVEHEVRVPTRAATKVTNYNVDDDSDEFLESDYDQGQYVEWVEDTSPGIDVILDHRVKEEFDAERYADSRDHLEFLIKWTEQAHIHATWESSADLGQRKGFRKLNNYMNKVKQDVERRNDPETTREDLERWTLERERQVEAVLEAKEVERVVASRDEGNGLEYLVKWRSLTYDNCTWEADSFLQTVAATEISQFRKRTKSARNYATSPLKKREKCKFWSKQPEYIQFGELRDFQLKGVNWLRYNWSVHRNSILADEMGLGKTVQTVAFLSWLKNSMEIDGPFLVVVPLSTVPAWCDTFVKWAPDLNFIVYNGPGKARTVIQEHEMFQDATRKKTKFHVMITTYEYVNHDAQLLQSIRWNYLAVDEAHRLKNVESRLYESLKQFKVEDRLLITGTPLQNNLSELVALLEFLDPGNINIDRNIDLQSEQAEQEIKKLQETLQPYILRRVKKDVETSLPQKTEKIIRVELSDIQTEWYKNIYTRNYSVLNARSKQKVSLLNIVMELKKISNHPFLFPSAEEDIMKGLENKSKTARLNAMIMSSGKMVLMDRFLKKMKADGHRVLIFSQMVNMLDLLQEYLDHCGYAFQRIDGTVSASNRKIAIDRFNAPGSDDFCFLLSTRAGGLGINLTTADTVIIFDSDWNPQADLQAMARAHRIGQKNHVMIYRFVSKDTIEEEVLERARVKLLMEYAVYMGITDSTITDKVKKTSKNLSQAELANVLAARAHKIFEGDKEKQNQEKLETLDIEDYLQHAEDHDTDAQGASLIRNEGGEAFQELLKQFEVTDIGVDWDSVLPPEQLESLRAADKLKQDEEFLQEQIQANAKRVRTRPMNGVNESDSSGSEKAPTRGRRGPPKKRRPEPRRRDDSSDEEGEIPDPSRPLTEREIRNLYNAFVRYGLVDDRYVEIVRDAKLQDRDREVIASTIKDIVRLSEEAIKTHEAAQKEEGITRKDKKAILFEYKGVKDINAEKVTQIPDFLRVLRTAISGCPTPLEFRIATAKVKTEKWSCEWGAKEDGMLCLGIDRYGYKNWVPIRDDPELGLKDKMFLEEHRVDKKAERVKGGAAKLSPGAEHLSRRANYLLGLLKDQQEKTAQQQAAAAARYQRGNRNSNSASPIPGKGRKGVKPVGAISKKRPIADRDGGDESPSKRPKNGKTEKKEVQKNGILNYYTKKEAGGSSLKKHRRESDVSRDDAAPHKKRRDDDKRAPHGDKHSKEHHKEHHKTNGAAKNGVKRKSHDRDEPNGSAPSKGSGASGSPSPRTGGTTERAEDLMWPIKKTLKKLFDLDKDKQDVKAYAILIRKELMSAGQHINDVLELNAKGSTARNTLELELWEVVACHWPHREKRLPGERYRHMYRKYQERINQMKVKDTQGPGEANPSASLSK